MKEFLIEWISKRRCLAIGEQHDHLDSLKSLPLNEIGEQFDG